jgi:phosphate uptake regulator
LTLTRRVQLTGRSTFIVSLPKEWALRWGLQRGSEVLIEQLPDGSLLLKPKAGQTRAPGARVKRIRVTTEDDLDSLIMEIIASYLAGCNVVEVLYGSNIDPKLVVEAIEEARKRALGLEVVEEDYGRVVLNTITGPPTISLSKAFERMIHVTRSMLENLSEAFKAPNEALLESIVERDTVVDKFFLLVTRQLTMVLQGQMPLRTADINVMPEILYKVIAAKSIERVADHAVLIATLLKNTRREAVVTDDLLEAYDAAREIFKISSRAFLELDKPSALKARRLATGFSVFERKVRQGLLNTAYLPDATAILDSIKRTVAYSMDLVEATVNIVTLRESSKASPENE